MKEVEADFSVKTLQYFLLMERLKSPFEDTSPDGQQMQFLAPSLKELSVILHGKSAGKGNRDQHEGAGKNIIHPTDTKPHHC